MKQLYKTGSKYQLNLILIAFLLIMVLLIMFKMMF